MSRLHQQRTTVRFKSRALALSFVAALAGACGDDDKSTEDGGSSDASAPDGSRPDAGPGSDAGRDGSTGDAAGPDAQITDAGGDAGFVDETVPGMDAPVLAKVGYFNDELGPRILLTGTDKNGDIDEYTIKLFKGMAPALVDIDGDQVSMESELTAKLTKTPGRVGFAFKLEPSLELLSNVDNIKVIVKDSGGRPSAELSATLMTAPTTSGTCDPQGFTRCNGTAVCNPNPAGTAYACTPITSARTMACAAPLELRPPAVTSVRGTLSNASLWDTPDGCSSMNPKRNPDRLVKLHLDTAASVTLSTNNANTGFNTALYVLSKCIDPPVACTAQPCTTCADEEDPLVSTRAVLTLSNLPAGDHLIVVDSPPSAENTSTNFELTVQVL